MSGFYGIKQLGVPQYRIIMYKDLPALVLYIPRMREAQEHNTMTRAFAWLFEQFEQLYVGWQACLDGHRSVQSGKDSAILPTASMDSLSECRIGSSCPCTVDRHIIWISVKPPLLSIFLRLQFFLVDTFTLTLTSLQKPDLYNGDFAFISAGGLYIHSHFNLPVMATSL